MASAGAAPAVSVVVVSHDSGRHLARCLDALRRQTLESFEAIVVDCASADQETLRAAIPADGRFRLVALDVNIGFAAASNLAARQANGAWLALLNPDAFAAPDWLERLLAATHRHPEVRAFGSTQLDAADPATLDGAGDAYHALGFPWRMGRGHPTAGLADGDRPVFSVCAAAALYERAAFAAMGGFDEAYFCFLEDVDLGFRLRLSGGGAIQVSDAMVRHVGGGSGGGQPDFARYHGTRNMIWTLAKNLPGPLLGFLLPAHLVVAAVIAVAALLTATGTARIRGLRDGLGGLRPALRQHRAIHARRKLTTRDVVGLLSWRIGPYLRRDIVALGESPPDRHPAAIRCHG